MLLMKHIIILLTINAVIIKCILICVFHVKKLTEITFCVTYT